MVIVRTHDQNMVVDIMLLEPDLGQSTNELIAACDDDDSPAIGMQAVHQIDYSWNWRIEITARVIVRPVLIGHIDFDHVVSPRSISHGMVHVHERDASWAKRLEWISGALGDWHGVVFITTPLDELFLDLHPNLLISSTSFMSCILRSFGMSNSLIASSSSWAAASKSREMNSCIHGCSLSTASFMASSTSRYSL